MGLKCVLIRADFQGLSFLRRSQEFLFLLDSEEEARLSRCLSERMEACEVLVSASLSRNVENQIVEQELIEIRRLLTRSVSLVVSASAGDSAQVAEVLCEAHLRGSEVLDLENALAILDPRVPIGAGALAHMITRLHLHQGFALRFYSSLKSWMQPVLALVLLLILSPVILAVAVMVKLTSPGPIFYRQTRLGHQRQIFEIIKFRSMRADAEKDGPVWASASTADARLTPVGGFLRATHLDEIPQIWNVVRGELSFVGPRPERPVFCQELEQKIPAFRLRTLAKPGITGWAQVRAGYANSVADSQRKLEFDLYYILKHSPALDLRIVLETLAILFAGGSEGRKRMHGRIAESKRGAAPGLLRNEAAALESARVEIG